VPAPTPVYVPPAFSWTGFYVGGNLGGAWANTRVTDTTLGADFGRSSNSVFIGGGQLGANYQFGAFVLGAEWDFDWAGSDNDPTATIGGLTLRARAHDKWISTATARFGFANDRWLWYGKAGGGWIGHDNITVTNVATGASITGGGEKSNSGWVVGAGTEWAFANNWTAKVEYEYLGLDRRTFVVPAGSPFLAGDTITHGDRNVQTVKAGVNYLFNWGVR